jgi:RNA polymerase sigma-70 factor (ECF subfamily)
MTPALAIADDSTLIRLALEGQAEGFAVLMHRHLPAVKKRIGSMVHNASDADDVLQEVSLKVWGHLSTFRAESPFRTWIIRVAINEVLQSYRRVQRRPTCQILADSDAVCPGESPYQSLARAEESKIVHKAVAELPATYRQVLILRDLKQLSARETARCLRSSIPAVKTRLFRARVMLSTLLQRRSIRSLAGGGR